MFLEKKKHERVDGAAVKNTERKQLDVVDRMLEALSRVVNDSK